MYCNFVRGLLSSELLCAFLDGAGYFFVSLQVILFLMQILGGFGSMLSFRAGTDSMRLYIPNRRILCRKLYSMK